MSNKTSGKRKRNSEKEEISAQTCSDETKNKSLSSKLALLDENLLVNDKTTSQSNAEDKEPKKCYWLMKSEPESRIENGHEMKFSFDDLKSRENQITCWDGVRNFEARNHMKSMKIGQRAFFYHSNCKNPGIIGIVEVCRESYVDHTQFDPKDAHYDPKSDVKNPKWFMVDVRYVRQLKRFIPLTELKHYHLLHKKDGKGPLANLSLFTRSRLSVQSIKEQEWNYIIELENKDPISLK